MLNSANADLTVILRSCPKITGVPIFPAPVTLRPRALVSLLYSTPAAAFRSPPGILNTVPSKTSLAFMILSSAPVRCCVPVARIAAMTAGSEPETLNGLTQAARAAARLAAVWEANQVADATEQAVVALTCSTEVGKEYEAEPSPWVVLLS